MHRRSPTRGGPSLTRLASCSSPGTAPTTRLGKTGSQRPLSLFHVDLDAARIVEALPLEGHPRETTYAICILPDGFDDPPERLDFG